MPTIFTLYHQTKTSRLIRDPTKISHAGRKHCMGNHRRPCRPRPFNTKRPPRHSLDQVPQCQYPRTDPSPGWRIPPLYTGGCSNTTLADRGRGRRRIHRFLYPSSRTFPTGSSDRQRHRILRCCHLNLRFRPLSFRRICPRSLHFSPKALPTGRPVRRQHRITRCLRPSPRARNAPGACQHPH